MRELYQQMILAHNKSPRNFRIINNPTHYAEGHNQLCGDSLELYLILDDNKLIEDISFQGHGCAITKSAASMMTEALKGKTEEEARKAFEQFHLLITGKLQGKEAQRTLGKLAIFSGVWEYPARVKCASLSWHTAKAALDKREFASTE